MVKRIFNVHSLDEIIATAGMSSIYATLDTVHMTSLRDYVYDHLTYQPGQKPRTKAEMITAIVSIVTRTKTDQNRHRQNQSRRPIDATTQRYAGDALTECTKMKKILDGNCRGLRKFSRSCRTAKKRLEGADWVRMESNIQRIQACDEQCSDSVVDAAGDIGNYLASCPGLTCYAVSQMTGRMPGGACKRFQK